MRAIFLVGFMGSGKSKLAKQLATKLNCTAIDTDEFIEKQEHCTIAELFEKHGEQHFRDLERQLIQELDFLQRIVVATGGGLPCHSSLMEEMNRRGTTVFLKLNAKELHHRLKEPKRKMKRPLIANKSEEELLDFITDKLEERELFYNQAAHVFHPTKDDFSDLIQWLLLHERNS
ncbi:MAG: shikimate kinase [Bacteroidota bacterium]